MTYKYNIETFIAQGKKPILNLGCGQNFHPDWVNIDFLPVGDQVIQHNLTTGIPFDNETFSVVYHSHVLEHFTAEQGRFFIQECYRILKPGGVIRIAVPDLEVIARKYLEYFDKAVNGDKSALEKYNWMKIELYDQVTRQTSGGEYLKFLQESSEELRGFARERLGREIDSIIASEKKPATKIKRSLADYIGFIKATTIKFLGFLFGDKNLYESYRMGNFRMSGEIHQCMYDKLSLEQLVAACQFSEIKVTGAFESRFSGFDHYHLDTFEGKVRKPDSLFIEAIK